MKNKSKLKKIKENKNRGFKCPNGWFLMSRNEITVEDIFKVFTDGEDIEIWPEVGVLEIVMGEKASIDIEEIETDLGDDEANAFLSENEIRGMLYISFDPSKYEMAEPYLKKISAALECMICGDTEDLLPVIE